MKLGWKSSVEEGRGELGWRGMAVDLNKTHKKLTETNSFQDNRMEGTEEKPCDKINEQKEYI